MAKQMPLKEALEVLQRDGLEIPPELKKYAKELDYQQRKIKDVWRCRTCYKEYESEIKLTGSECSCGGIMQLIYRNSDQT